MAIKIKKTALNPYYSEKERIKDSINIARFKGGLNVAFNKDIRGTSFVSGAWRDKNSKISNRIINKIENLRNQPEDELLRNVEKTGKTRVKELEIWRL